MVYNEANNLKILAVGEDDCVHLATSEDGFRSIFFQGHPEYDTISLLKEYKREVLLFIDDKRKHYPPFPERYFGVESSAILREYKSRLLQAMQHDQALPEFPENLIVHSLDNTWHDTAGEVISNWVGLIYQLTHSNRKLPFMDGVDPLNPLSL